MGPHRAQIGISTGDTHGVSRADSTPGHGDTPRAGHGGDGTPDAPTTPRKEQTFEEALGGGDKQPHSGKPAADTPATHADEATDTTKAGHGFSDANGSGKADADAKQGHDSVEHADADPKAKDHSANGEADDAADSAHHGDKTEADKPTSEKSHKEDDAAHHDADSKPDKGKADTHKSDKDSVERNDGDPKAEDHSANDKADDADDSARRSDKSETDKAEADKPTSDKSHQADDAEHPKDTDGDAKSDKDADNSKHSKEENTPKHDKDADQQKDTDSTADKHARNGRSDDAADARPHRDKEEAGSSTKDPDSEHPDDSSRQNNDSESADGDSSDSSRDERGTEHGDRDADGDSGEHESSTSDEGEEKKEYEDLHDRSHDGEVDPSYDPSTDPHTKCDEDYDTPPDPSIDQTVGFPEGVDPYTTPPRTRRQLQEALEAWPEYMKKELPQDATEWHTGRFGFDDMVNPERALGFNPDGSPRSMKDFMDTFFDKEKGQPVWPFDVAGKRKNGTLLNAGYHEYDSIQPFIDKHGSDLCRLGDPEGKFAAAMHKDGTLPSFGERGLFQPFSLGAPDMRARLTGELPEGHIVKYCQVAPAFGQPGGAIQLQIWGPDETTGKTIELPLETWKKRGIIEYVQHD